MTPTKKALDEIEARLDAANSGEKFSVSKQIDDIAQLISACRVMIDALKFYADQELPTAKTALVKIDEILGEK